MTKKKTTMIQNDSQKETAPNNCRPITCLPMMGKILTAQIKEEIYYTLISCVLLPEEQKRCHKGTRGTYLPYIDPHILKESRTRRKNVQRAWTDYKKAHDIVSQAG